MALTGFDITRLPSLNAAIQHVLDLLYAGILRPTKPVIQKHISKSQHNEQLRTRYAAGESIADLAREYEISDQRVFQIIHYRQRGQVRGQASLVVGLRCPHAGGRRGARPALHPPLW